MLCIDPVEHSIRDFYEKGTAIVLETQDLILRSVQETDRKDFQALYTDPEVMLKFTDNAQRMKEKGASAWTEEQRRKADHQLQVFLQRFQEKNPFSAFTIFDKKTGSFEGFIVTGLTSKPGCSEMSAIFRKEAWNKTYATQATTAVVTRFLPALIKVHYQLKGTPPMIANGPFQELIATTRQDNIYVGRILQKLGMEKTGSIEKWGYMRDVYRIKYESIPKIV